MRLGHYRTVMDKPRWSTSFNCCCSADRGDGSRSVVRVAERTCTLRKIHVGSRRYGTNGWRLGFQGLLVGQGKKASHSGVKRINQVRSNQ